MRRNTLQRKMVLGTIGLLGHATINMLKELLSSQFPELSLATLYRNIDVLLDEGEIRRVTTNLKEDYYEIVDEENEHDHFICTECGSIIDVPITSKENIENLGSNVVEKVSKTYYGICEECISKNAS